MIKSARESNCKRFRKNVKRENFNLKPETLMQKTHSHNGGNYTHQYIEIKEKLKPVFFIYAWTTFEHQVKDMYASQKVQVFIVFAGQKHISGTHRTTNEQVH